MIVAPRGYRIRLISALAARPVGLANVGRLVVFPRSSAEGSTGVADDGRNNPKEDDGDNGGGTTPCQAESGKDRVERHPPEAAVERGLVGGREATCDIARHQLPEKQGKCDDHELGGVAEVRNSEEANHEEQQQAGHHEHEQSRHRAHEHDAPSCLPEHDRIRSAVCGQSRTQWKTLKLDGPDRGLTSGRGREGGRIL